ncbi:unnamed protein product [Sphacelaria rigidula]
MGRLFISLSLAMSVGIACLLTSKATATDYSVVHGGALLSITGYFFVAALLALRHARNKNYALHRKWILRHVATGYSVSLQRVALALIPRGLMPKLMPEYNDLTQAGADLRVFVIGVSFWGSMIVSICAMELWLSHTSKRHTNGLGEPPAAAASVHRKAN